MDLVQVLKQRIEALPEGEYSLGLDAVHNHVVVATNHLERGRSALDETAFTDAIYRTNQAFEGSLKEAYRVIALEDPTDVRPFDIENYLEQNNRLRKRVLDHLVIYRKQWRNPSTHDYRLDFDEDEALLAIVNVAVFAIVLVDQIAGELAYRKAAEEAARSSTALTNLPKQGFPRIEQALVDFATSAKLDDQIHESTLLSAISGYINSVAPDVKSTVEPRIATNRGTGRPDLLLEFDAERILIEVKRGSRNPLDAVHRGAQQLSNYMRLTGIRKAILFIYSKLDEKPPLITHLSIPELDAEISIVSQQSIDLKSSNRYGAAD